MAHLRSGKVVTAALLIVLLLSVLCSAEAAISYLRPKFTVAVNQTVCLPVTGDPAAQWASSKGAVLSVDENGLVKGLKVGTSKLRVIDETGKSALATVRVVAAKRGVTRIKLNAAAKTIVAGKKFTLKATLTPKTATDRSITWISSDKKIATVSTSGVVTGKKAGTAVITAVSSSGYTATCTVTVTPVTATSVKLNKKSGSLKVGGTVTLKATVSPSNASDKSVTWESTDPEIATVVNGKVTALKPGTVSIRATTANGKTALCKVKVTAVKPTKIKLNLKSGKLDMDTSGQLKATVTPANATDKSVTWKSSNPSVASVDENGLVTAHMPGTATITVKSNGNTKLSATCKITVKGSVSMAKAAELLNSVQLKPRKSGYAPLDTKIEELFKELFTDDMTPYQKVKAVFDYMTVSNKYLRNHSLPGIKGYTDIYQGKALYILTYHQGSCTDYSAAFMYMMRAIGFDCEVQYGQTSALAGGWTGHYWNNVIINGVEYIFDPQVEKNTMDGDIITYTRFCKTYAEMTKKYRKG